MRDLNKRLARLEQRRGAGRLEVETRADGFTVVKWVTDGPRPTEGILTVLAPGMWEAL